MPLQGVLLIAIIPRAMPWARSFCPFRAGYFWSFWAFSPYLNHLRKFSKLLTINYQLLTIPSYLFLAVSVMSGMSISSIEMPPCWKVSL